MRLRKLADMIRRQWRKLLFIATFYLSFATLLTCGYLAPDVPNKSKAFTFPVGADNATEVHHLGEPSEHIAQTLKADGLPITNVHVYSPADDKNIGQAWQYTSRVTFNDSRVKNSGDWIGEVTTYNTINEANSRYRELKAQSDTSAAMSEYLYVDGVALLRLGHELSESQAKLYSNAFST